MMKFMGEGIMVVKKIFLGIMLLMLVLIPSVSALELNPFADKMISVEDKAEVHNYLKADFNAKYGAIQISKTFLWIETDKIAEYSLVDNSDKCYIDCKASGKAVLYSDGSLFDDFDVIDVYSKEIVNLKQFDTYIEVEEGYQERVADKFDKVCSTTLPLTYIGLADNTGYIYSKEIRDTGFEIILRKDGKELCKDIVSTYKNITKTRIVNQKYDGEVLKAGSYTWTINAEKDPTQNLDWAVGMRGVTTDQVREKWAEWTTANCHGVGGSVTLDGDYCVNTFTANGTFELKVSISELNVTYLVVGAGGQGGTWGGGGGGAGGVIYNQTGTLIEGDWDVVIAPETPTATTNSRGINGANSEFGSVIALGGGGGGNAGAPDGLAGGSGGGAQPTGTGGAGTSGQGNDGGSGGANCGGGGGSPESAGIQGTESNAGHGADGSIIDINGSSSYYGAGGGGIYYVSTCAERSLGGAGQVAFGGSGGNDGGATACMGGNGGYGFGGGGAWDVAHTDYGGSGTQGVVIVRYLALNDLQLTLNSPADDLATTNPSIAFNCSAVDGVGVLNLTLIIDGSDNYTITNSTAGQSLEIAVSRTLSNGNHTWTCRASDGTGIDDPVSTSVRFITLDNISPTISTTNLTDQSTFSLPINSSWVLNATDPHLDTCYYNSTDHANTIVTCNSTIETQWATTGTKTINYCANDTYGNLGCASQEIIINFFNVTATENNDPIGEGDSVIFTLNLGALEISSVYSETNASFTLNGVEYSTDTKSTIDPNNIVFSKTVVIPKGIGNSTGKTLDWNFDWDIRNTTTSKTSGSSSSNITVYNMSISDSCAGKYVFSTIKLYDEEDLDTALNITAPNLQNIEVDLTITSLANSSIYWEYATSWNNSLSNTLCVADALLNYSSYRLDWIIGYDATDRVREFHYLDNGTLDKTGVINSLTSNVTNLLDLQSADSTTFLFSYTDEDGLAVPNSIVHTFRKYIGEGIFREAERSKQDNNGETHVHLVEEDVIYYFIISEDSEILYTSDTYNAKCLSTPCAIDLTGSSTETNWSLYDNEGGQYLIATNRATRTASITFNLATSGTVNASVYEYDAGVSTYVVSDVLTATAGTIDLVVPLSYSNSTYFVAVHRDDVFVKSGWLDLTESGKEYFGTFGALLGGLIVLALILMAITEGIGLIIFTALALILVGVMQLVELSWLSIISIISAGGIIVWKLTNRTRRQG